MSTTSERSRAHAVTGPGAPGRSRSREPTIFRSLSGGLLGTLAITLMTYVADPILTGRAVDIARLLSFELSSPHQGGRVAVYFFNGVVLLPLGFAFCSGQLPGPRVVKGLIWGMILWSLALSLVIPTKGSDFFGYPAGSLRAVIRSLAGYLVYGGLQGLIAGRPAGTDTNRDRSSPGQTGIRVNKRTRFQGGT